MTPLPAILLLALVGGLMDVARACDTSAMKACLAPLLAMRDDSVFRTFADYTLAQRCTAYSTADTCMTESILKGCEAKVTAPWKGLKDSLSYLCSDDGKSDFAEYRPCLITEAFITPATKCEDDFKVAKRTLALADDPDLCTTYKTFIACVHDGASSVCNAKTANWLRMMMAKMTQPKADLTPDFDCKLGCAAVQASLFLVALSSLLFYFFQ